MKKLMISILLVLGMYQTTTPMFSTATKAAYASLGAKTTSQALFNAAAKGMRMATRSALLGGLMVAPMFLQSEKAHSVLPAAMVSFLCKYGLMTEKLGWGWNFWEKSQYWDAQLSHAVRIAGLVGGLGSGAGGAYSFFKGTSQQEQPVGAPVAQGQLVPSQPAQNQPIKATPEMIAARKSLNARTAQKVAYKPLVIRANQK